MGFIENYVAWATECTDAPAIYHKWGAYAALSARLGKRVVLKFGRMRIPPNLYILLLGPSSIYRKTTAMKMSQWVAYNAGAYTLPGDGSPEGFIEDLEEHPAGTLYYSELASLLSMFERDYSAGFKPMLTDFFDAPQEFRRKLKKKEYVIKNPCVNVFTCSVLSWVMDRVKHSDFGGGFLARFVFVNSYKKEKHWSIPPEDKDIQIDNGLTHMVKDLAVGVEGEVSLEPIREPYSKWETEYQARVKTPLMASFTSRLAITALKVALLEEISASGTTNLTEGSLNKAILSIEEVSRTIEVLEETEFSYSDDRDGTDLRQVSRLIRVKGELEYRALLRSVHLPTQRVERVLQTLQASQQINIVRQDIPGKRGPKMRIVTWIGKNEENEETIVHEESLTTNLRSERPE